MRSLRRLAVCLSLLATANAAAPPDYRFKVEVLAEGIPQPMQLEIAPDGRIFFVEIKGKVRIYKPRERQIVEAGALDVFNGQENGLLGMALDPHFASNGWIYLLHSPNDFHGQVLSRFTVRGDALDMGSRKEVLRYEEQRRECCHHAGCMRFGPDGNLYISSGDNTHPHGDSGGYAPIDERPDKFPWDAQKSAANTNDLRGKIIRIRPTPEGGYTIPPGNLFPVGAEKTRPEIYAMGCRNPWRFNIDPKTGILYFGDVGPDAGKDDPQRGPRGFDTINQVRGAGNWGWPYVRGNERYFEFDYDTKKPLGQFDPQKPINNSPNNTGLRELPPVQPPLIWYPGMESAEFPILGKGGRTACAGPVFHFRPEFKETSGFPDHYDNCLLIYDWSRPFLKWARLDKDSKLAGIEEFSGAIRVALGPRDDSDRFQIKRPVDAVFGADGCLYLFDYGETWGANADSRLVKISYQWGNLAPISKASAKPTAGREPLTIALSSEGSKDHEGDALRYEWRLGEKVIGTEPAAKLTLNEPGSHRIELRVTDANGASSTAVVPVTVGNTPPQVRFEQPQDGDFFTPGRPVRFRVEVHDLEDGNSTLKSDEFSVRTLVSVAWSKGEGAPDEPEPGLALMKQGDCFNCHAAEQTIVGPPLVEIANRYRGNFLALDTAVDRVIKGSTGVWGQVPMLPHPQHSTDEVHMMVKWIFSLEKGKGSPSMTRGLSGEIVAPTGDATRFGTLEATYTDAGRPPAGALAGAATVRLRSRRIEAEHADSVTGPKEVGGSKASGKKALGAIADGHTVRFVNLNLADTAGVTARVSSGGQGGRIELRAGDKNGDLLAMFEVVPTGGWDEWKEITVPLNSPPARGDVTAVFINPGKGGLMNLDWVQFNPR